VGKSVRAYQRQGVSNVKKAHENRGKAVYACKDATRPQNTVSLAKESVLELTGADVVHHREREDRREATVFVWHRSCVAATHRHIRGWEPAFEGSGKSSIDFQALDVFGPIPE